MAPPISGSQFGQYGTQAGATSNPTLIPDKEKQPQGSGYTNLQSILAANQGNQLGGAVTGAVSGAGQKAQQGLSSSQQAFGQGLSTAQGDLSNRQSMVNNTFKNYDTSGNVTPGAATGFADLRSDQYNGPKGLNNSQQLQQQSQNAAQMGQMGQSAGGRQQLLSTVIGTPGYTGAQQREDALFLAPSQGALRSAGLQNQRLTGQVNQAINSAQNAGTAQANALKQLQQNTAQGIQQRQGTVNSAIQGQVEQAQKQNTTQQANTQVFQDALSKFASGQGDAATLQNAAAKAGISPQQVALLQQLQTYNSNLGNPEMGSQLGGLFNYGNIDTSQGGNTNAQQVAQLNALASLAGTPQQYTNNPSATTQTGLNNPNLKNYIGTLGQTEQGKIDQLNTQVGQLQNPYNNIINNPIFANIKPGDPNYDAYVAPYLAAQSARTQQQAQMDAINALYKNNVT